MEKEKEEKKEERSEDEDKLKEKEKENNISAKPEKRKAEKMKENECIPDEEKKEENIDKKKESRPNIDDVQKEVIVFTDNELHDEINDEKVENLKGFEVKTLTAYVNDEQISAHTIYPEETEEEREQRMAIIGSSLEIKNLENQIDAELVLKLRVQDTEQKIEQRIERLKEVLNLLKSHKMLADKKISIPQLKSNKRRTSRCRC